MTHTSIGTTNCLSMFFGFLDRNLYGGISARLLIPGGMYKVVGESNDAEPLGQASTVALNN